jgi:phosphinothricin acetyltransferase
VVDGGKNAERFGIILQALDADGSLAGRREHFLDYCHSDSFRNELFAEDDLPAIIEIYNQSIPAGRSTADTEPITVTERLDWFRKFDAKKRPIWVVLDQERIVGCIYLSSFYGGRPAYDKTAEISTYIAASHQGKGIGTMLKERMIEACPRLGVENLLSMYFDHNEATQCLNDKFGFEGVGHLPGIAEVFGKKRGLRISLLRITKSEQAGAGNALENLFSNSKSVMV